MISTTNRVASDRNVSVYVVPEVEPGVLAYPDSSHFIGQFDDTYPVQTPEFENSKVKAPTRDVINRCQGKTPAGEWGFSTECYPQGLGVPPDEKDLLLSLTGLETINVGVDVEYTPAIQKKSVSIWFLIDHTMIFCSGATVGTGALKLDDCPVIWEWGGGFMKMGQTGTDPLTAPVSPADQVIQVTDSNKFAVGGLIVFADDTGVIVDDNAGAGYLIDSVPDFVSIHISTPALIGVAAGGIAAPFNPGGTLNLNALGSRSAIAEIAGVQKAIIDFTFEIKDEPEYLDREKTPSGYPENYAETQREVTGEINLSFKRDESGQFKKSLIGDQSPIKLTIGQEPGYILVIDMPRCLIETPTIEDDEPIVKMMLKYTALATAGEDSYRIIYK